MTPEHSSIPSLEGNWPVVLKLRWIWKILTQALKSLKNFHFNAILLSKVYIVWARKVQRSYLLWHWGVTKKLERNRLVVTKLTWGIWQILTWALESVKNFYFNVILLSKVYLVCAKEAWRSCLMWLWSVTQNLERNWLVVTKLAWGIWQILIWVMKSVKNFYFNGPLLSKVCVPWTKKSKEEFSFITMKMQNLERNWLIISKLTWGICQILVRALKSQKFSF